MAERKCARKALAFLISTPLPSSESSVSVSIVGGKENCEEDQDKSESERDGECV
jgi:hypothetical protein